MDVREILQRTKTLYEMREATQCEQERQRLRNEVVELNIRLVPHILKKYKPYSEDTYQVGCIGLIKAADSYETSKMVPFVNFACICIENEIKLAHKYHTRSFEGQAGFDLKSISEFYSGDEDGASLEERVEDVSATQDMEGILERESLDILFYDYILPSIEKYSTRAATIDLETWKELEIQYILEIAQGNTQQGRLTFAQMAEQLVTSIQNVRTRHDRVFKEVKDQIDVTGYYEPGDSFK